MIETINESITRKDMRGNILFELNLMLIASAIFGDFSCPEPSRKRGVRWRVRGLEDWPKNIQSIPLQPTGFHTSLLQGRKVASKKTIVRLSTDCPDAAETHTSDFSTFLS